MTDQPLEEKLEERFQRLYLDEYTITHKKRFARTYGLLSEFIKTGEEHILEVGDGGNFKDFIKGDHPKITIENTDSDLRYYLSKVGGQYDILLNMEVLEHIKDQNEGVIHMFDGGGAKVFIDECFRMLKPNGVMILTTPNAHSLDNIEKILTYQAPMLFRPHVREYTMYEVEQLVTEAGFKVERLYSADVWDNVPRTWRKEIELIALGAGMDPNKWGQDIFLVARKG